MATRKERPPAPGEVPTAAEVALLGYEGLVAAWAAVDAHWPGPDPDGSKFRARSQHHAPMVGRLEELAKGDPRVVRWVADANARPRTIRPEPGDLDHAESALALAAIRSSEYLTDTGCRRRRPFAALSANTTHHQRSTDR